MRYLPVFFELARRPVAVVGGGAVALRKCRLLLTAGAQPWLIAPQLLPELAALAAAGTLTHVAEPFSPAALDRLPRPVLLIAATDDDAVNAAVHAAGQVRAIPVNVVDDPARCDFIFPAIVDRSPLIVAVSSGGAAPVLARQVRSRLESVLPSRLAQLAALADELRPAVKARLPDLDARRRYWETALNSPAAELALAGDMAGARAGLLARLDAAAKDALTVTGSVALIGAGSGTADDLTFRALRLLQQAETVYHAAGLSTVVLDLARRDADRVGLAADADPADALATAALAGQRLAWLTPGSGRDFDRVARELTARGVTVLRAAGIDA